MLDPCNKCHKNLSRLNASIENVNGKKGGGGEGVWPSTRGKKGKKMGVCCRAALLDEGMDGESPRSTGWHYGEVVELQISSHTLCCTTVPRSSNDVRSPSWQQE